MCHGSCTQGASIIIYWNCNWVGYKPIATALIVLAPLVEFTPTADVIRVRSTRYIVVTATLVVNDVVVQLSVVTTRLQQHFHQVYGPSCIPSARVSALQLQSWAGVIYCVIITFCCGWPIFRLRPYCHIWQYKGVCAVNWVKPNRDF